MCNIRLWLWWLFSRCSQVLPRRIKLQNGRPTLWFTSIPKLNGFWFAGIAEICNEASWWKDIEDLGPFGGCFGMIYEANFMFGRKWHLPMLPTANLSNSTCKSSIPRRTPVGSGSRAHQRVQRREGNKISSSANSRLMVSKIGIGWTGSSSSSSCI